MSSLEKDLQEIAYHNMLKNKAEAQVNYCTFKEIPTFAPIDGWCYSCGKNIYSKITLDQASSDVITGCPHCHHSFVS